VEHNPFLSDIDTYLISDDIEEFHTATIINPPEVYNQVPVPNPRFKKAFYKLECFNTKLWGDYGRLVYIDADILCLGPIKSLFGGNNMLSELVTTSALDHGYKLETQGRINTGVMVINTPRLPSDTYKWMLDHALAGKSYDHSDQGVINAWMRKEKLRHVLPVEYNTLKRMYTHNRGIYDNLNVRLLHFVGDKPWFYNRAPEYEPLYRIWDGKDIYLPPGVTHRIDSALKQSGGRSRPDKSYPSMFKLLEKEKGTVLDIGCGRCMLGECLKVMFPGKFTVVGVEPFTKYLPDNYVDSYKMVLTDNYLDMYTALNDFDIYVFADVLEHFTRDEAISVIKHLQSLGKKILVSIPVSEKYWKQSKGFIDENILEYHKYNWTASDIEKDLGLTHYSSVDGIGVFCYGL